MILVDTSVVIDAIRGKDAKLEGLLAALPVAICGVVPAEVLCGAQDAAHRAKLVNHLIGSQPVIFPDALWDSVGDNLATLRKNGVTVPMSDVINATLGIHLDIEVWARDSHYVDMQKALPALKLFHEPP